MPNNREIAILVWLAIGIIFLLAHAPTRSSLRAVASTLFKPVLLVPLALFSLWVVALVIIGLRLGLWTSSLFTDTVFWFFGPAIVLFFNLNNAQSQEGFFRRAVLSTVEVTILVELFMNIFVLGLIAELILQPFIATLFLLATVASLKPEHSQIKAMLERFIAGIGLLMVAYVIYRFVEDWRIVDTNEALRDLVLPIWLTLGIVPLIYLLSMFAAYQSAFLHISYFAESRMATWRVLSALAFDFRGKVREIGAFRAYWARQAASASTFHETRDWVRKFKKSREAEVRKKIEKECRLETFAGAEGTDEDGRQLDQREFESTKQALEFLHTSQMGHYKNQGSVYHYDLLSKLSSAFRRLGLPEDHGIELHVAEDGQSWRAWRRTVTGWCFAIGAANPPPDEWRYDGPEPPVDFPLQDESWKQWPGNQTLNW